MLPRAQLIFSRFDQLIQELDQRAKMGERLKKFYKQYDPKKVTMEALETLLSGFAGDEEALNAQLRARYNADLNGIMPKQRAAPCTSTAKSPAKPTVGPSEVALTKSQYGSKPPAGQQEGSKTAGNPPSSRVAPAPSLQALSRAQTNMHETHAGMRQVRYTNASAPANQDHAEPAAAKAVRNETEASAFASASLRKKTTEKERHVMQEDQMAAETQRNKATKIMNQAVAEDRRLFEESKALATAQRNAVAETMERQRLVVKEAAKATEVHRKQAADMMQKARERQAAINAEKNELNHARIYI